MPKALARALGMAAVGLGAVLALLTAVLLAEGVLAGPGGPLGVANALYTGALSGVLLVAGRQSLRAEGAHSSRASEGSIRRRVMLNTHLSLSLQAVSAVVLAIGAGFHPMGAPLVIAMSAIATFPFLVALFALIEILPSGMLRRFCASAGCTMILWPVLLFLTFFDPPYGLIRGVVVGYGASTGLALLLPGDSAPRLLPSPRAAAIIWALIAAAAIAAVVHEP